MKRSNRLPLDTLRSYLLELPFVTEQPPSPWRWVDIFGNERPVEVEVGFGKGLFLTRAAAACPDVNFLGIDISRKYQLLAAGRLHQQQLSNVRLLKADARGVLRCLVPEDSVQAVHVYFPDPWWKKRHWKRRVFTEEFARSCARVLRPGGQLHVATDVSDYFAIIQETVSSQTELRPLPPSQATDPQHDLDYLTHFERKFRIAGRPIYRACYVK
ncbi:MAG: tRNA (guanosine(46)-N7)-methyltransferase TrmB [Gemmataceae bacterium]